MFVMYEVRLPPLGEGIEKATISYWYFEEGQKINKDQDLVEIATDKAVFNIPCPINGVLVKRLFQESEEVKVGEVLAIIEQQ